MKLSDLTEKGQADLRGNLERQARSWESSSVWWRGEDKTSKSEMEMKGWFAAFNKFSAAVLADEDIDHAFLEWSGQHVLGYDPGKLNAPQYGFAADYAHACRQLEIANNLITNEQT